MRHFTINEVKEPGHGYANSHVFYQRHFWSWTGPVNPLCWLGGHRPQLLWNGGASFVECARCPCRPQDSYAMQTVQVRLNKSRPGRNDYRTAQKVPPPTADEAAFIIQDVPRRGSWSQAEHDFRLEVLVPRRPRLETSVRLHIADRGTETPWGGHLTVLGAGVYWGLGFGGHFTERITRGRSRAIGVDLHSGRLWWAVWDTPGEWRSDQPKWWSGSFSVDPTEWLWGRRRYTYDPVGDPVGAVLVTAEGTVHDDLTLQLKRSWRGWERRPRPTRGAGWSVDWRSAAGIPVRHHNWKGDEVLASSVTLTDAEASVGDWTAAALGKLIKRISEDRAHYGWSLERYLRGQETEAER